LSHERIILRTVVGDLVLALYPEVAPLHVAQILRLVRHGVYDTTHVYSVRPHFVAQLSTAYDRQQPLSPEQQALIRPLPAEFNASVRHRKGVLSMARQPDDPHSAETSFSILLGDAPHLDGQYTIFGEVVRGFDVLEALVNVPRDQNDRPLTRVTIVRAEVVETPEQLRSMTLQPAQTGQRIEDTFSSQAVVFAGGIGLMLGVSLLGFVLPTRAGSLHVLNLLIGGFVLVVLLAPRAQHSPWLAGGLLVGLLGLFKLMSRYESPRPETGNETQKY
jgi:cyclophilin family peptidyl-prolyl cis-trans isomerase